MIYVSLSIHQSDSFGAGACSHQTLLIKNN